MINLENSKSIIHILLKIKPFELIQTDLKYKIAKSNNVIRLLYDIKWELETHFKSEVK